MRRAIAWRQRSPSPPRRSSHRPVRSAHPLGNFTTNQLVKVSIGEREAKLGRRSRPRGDPDLPARPALRPRRRRRDLGSRAAGAGRRARARARAGLALRADGRQVPLRPTGDGALSFPPGQAGLSLTRLEPATRRRFPPDAQGRGRQRRLRRPHRAGGRSRSSLARAPTSSRPFRPPIRPTASASTRRTCCRALRRTRGAASRSPPGADGSARRMGPTARAHRRPRRRRLRRPAHRRRHRTDSLILAPARHGVRLGCAARALAGPRQVDGRRLPRRLARAGRATRSRSA